MNRKTIKRWIGQIHLWLGLTIGILFFIIALSGAIYTWAPEISRVLYHEAVDERDTPFVPVSTLKKTIDQEFPEADFRTVVYDGPSTTAKVLLYAPGTYYYAFLNPYTGQLQHLQDMNKGWLNYIKFIHRNLLMGDFGREVVHWVTLLSLFMLITGIVLWWPTSRNQRKRVFSIRWNVSPWRLNYDLHNVLGFYASWVLIFLVLTGIYWGFDNVKSFSRNITSEDQNMYEEVLSDTTYMTENTSPFPIMDSLATHFINLFPHTRLRISNPHGKHEAIRVVLIDPRSLVYNTDHYYYDRYTGQEITGSFELGRKDDRSAFHQLNGLVYDIHFGNILGLPGRLLVFFGSLIAASLPTTGFLIWWKKKKPK